MEQTGLEPVIRQGLEPLFRYPPQIPPMSIKLIHFLLVKVT